VKGGFPRGDRCNRGILGRPRCPKAHSGIPTDIPVRGVHQPRRALWAHIPLERPNEELTAADLEDQRRMRKDTAVEFPCFRVRSTEKHRQARGLIPPDDHFRRPGKHVRRQDLGRDLRAQTLGELP